MYQGRQLLRVRIICTKFLPNFNLIFFFYIFHVFFFYRLQFFFILKKFFFNLSVTDCERIKNDKNNDDVGRRGRGESTRFDIWEGTTQRNKRESK
uniref:Uncharacterized protein n=1 Tax=Octopus bimaculoides TaxID=37653 RepID=A0A0L8HDB4_OCTBM